MNLFKRDQRKKYLKFLGLKYDKETKKYINNILKTDMPLEEFKILVTPMLDENKLKEKSIDDILKTMIIPNKEQMIELQKGFENGLSIEEVEIYKKPHLSVEDMKNVREFLISESNKEIKYGKLNYNVNKYKGKELKSYLSYEKAIRGEDVIYDEKELKEIMNFLPKREANKIILDERLLDKIDINSDIVKEFKVRISSPEMSRKYIDKNIRELFLENENYINIEELTKDSDGDGLTDIEEKYIYNTDPYSRDTDRDGRSDLEEIKKDGTNPRIKDEKTIEKEEREIKEKVLKKQKKKVKELER